MGRHAPSDVAKDRDRDASGQRYESNQRGECRYPDAHQRPAERLARKNGMILSSRNCSATERGGTFPNRRRVGRT